MGFKKKTFFSVMGLFCGCVFFSTQSSGIENSYEADSPDCRSLNNNTTRVPAKYDLPSAVAAPTSLPLSPAETKALTIQQPANTAPTSDTPVIIPTKP